MEEQQEQKAGLLSIPFLGMELSCDGIGDLFKWDRSFTDNEHFHKTMTEHIVETERKVAYGMVRSMLQDNSELKEIKYTKEEMMDYTDCTAEEVVFLMNIYNYDKNFDLYRTAGKWLDREEWLDYERI